MPPFFSLGQQALSTCDYRATLGLIEVKAVKRHNLGPGIDEIADKLLFAAVLVAFLAYTTTYLLAVSPALIHMIADLLWN